MYIVICYAAYLAASVGVTIWVAGSLRRNGRAFLIDAFHGDEAMADSVNRLLVVGFYLINIGYVTLALRTRGEIGTAREVIELFSDKVGLVLFSDRIELALPPRKGTHHVLRVIRELLSARPAGRGTDIAGALEHLAHVAKRRCVVFVLEEKLRADSMLAERLQRLYGFTASEAHVAIGVASSASLEELAVERVTKIGTIRTQVKSALAKTGARKQAEFIQPLEDGLGAH